MWNSGSPCVGEFTGIVPGVNTKCVHCGSDTMSNITTYRDKERQLKVRQDSFPPIYRRADLTTSRLGLGNVERAIKKHIFFCICMVILYFIKCLEMLCLTEPLKVYVATEAAKRNRNDEAQSKQPLLASVLQKIQNQHIEWLQQSRTLHNGFWQAVFIGN